MGAVQETLKQLEDEIPNLQGEIDFLNIQYLSSDDVLSEARDLHARWPQLERTEKRQIVETVVQNITVGKNEVEIHLYYLPSSSKDLTERQRNSRGSSPRRERKTKETKVSSARVRS